MLGEQEIIATYEPDQAIATLPALLPRRKDRERLLTLLDRLANDPRVRREGLTPEQRTMLERVRSALAGPARVSRRGCGSLEKRPWTFAALSQLARRERSLAAAAKAWWSASPTSTASRTAALESSANCGAELAVTWLNDKARPHVEPLARELSAVIAMPLDVEQKGAMEAVFAAIRERWGRLDFLLHSIAYAPAADLRGRVVDSSPEGFARAMDISCHSFMRMARLAEPLMDKGGTLLTMSYLGANEVVPNYGVMGPVKAALEASVRYMATELGPRGIRVNAVSPGPIKTRAASGIPAFDQLLADARSRAPAGARGRDRRRRLALRVPGERRRAGHDGRRPLCGRGRPHPRVSGVRVSARGAAHDQPSMRWR